MRTLIGVLEDSIKGQPELITVTPIVQKSIDAIEPLLKENPAMSTREIHARSGLSFATIVKYRKIYLEQFDMPQPKRGRKRMTRVEIFEEIAKEDKEK